jgi:hypothetical protein
MRDWKIIRSAFGLFAVACLAVCPIVPSARAQQPKDDQTGQAKTLDGMSFRGEFIPVGKTSGRPDQFIFATGTFHSRECLGLGFSPGPYSLQMKDGQLYFRSQLTSKENGVMTYDGYVTKETIEARIKWVKPRWYWTMRREFEFKGKRSSGAPDATK